MSKFKYKFFTALTASAAWASLAAAQAPLTNGPAMTIVPAQNAIGQGPIYILQDEKIEEAKKDAPAGNGNGCAACEEEEEEEEEEETCGLINLFDDCCGKNCLKDNGYVLGGVMSWGYSSNPDGSFIGNGPFLNQREWDGLLLNQAWLFFGKEADGSKGFDWGFRGDFYYGTDGNEGQAFGNIDPGHWDFLNGWDHGIYEYAMPQAYVEVAMGDLSVKAGHFWTNIGYEVVIANGNFFYSHQLTHWNSEPFTHTGVLASYDVSDKLTVQGGWVLGWDTGFYQYEGGNSFIGGFTYHIDDKSDFIFGSVAGNLGWRGNGAVNSGILTRQWTEKLQTVHQFDVLGTDLRQADGTPANFRDPASYTARNSTGFINYLFYDINDKLRAGFRGEWYKADGTSYYTCTYGVNIIPLPNVLIRPEIRHMWSPGNQDIYTGSGFSDELFNQTVFGIDAVFTF